MNDPSREHTYPHGEILASVVWLSAHLGDALVTVLDARDPKAYAEGHIPGAVSLGSTQVFKAEGSQEPVSAEEFARYVGALGVRPAQTVICYDAEGPSAARAWWAFWRFGHCDVRFLNGGLNQWLAAGKPLSQEARKLNPGKYELGEPRDEAACSLAQAIDKLGRPGVQFWDTRSKGEYAGSAARFATPARPGHIPGAIRLEWNDLTEPGTGLFKSADEMRRLLAAKGISPQAEIITY